MSRRGLRRRYGHAAMAKVREGASDLGKMAGEHPVATAALLGAGAGLVIAEMGLAPAAMAGAVAGVVIEKVTGK
jgi:hypothetical protein